MTPEVIYQELRVSLEKYKHVPQPKFAICFSGAPGSGKTTIAKKLEKDLQAVRISNDEIRPVIETAGITGLDEREQIKEEFLRWFSREVVTWPNGIIILDSGIDRRYPAFKKFFTAAGYVIFVISLEVSRQTLEKRIQSRPEHRAQPERMLETLDRWLSDKKQFMIAYGQDVAVHINTEKPVDYPALLDQINKNIKFAGVEL